MANGRAPFPRDPKEFDSDPRISFSKETGTFNLEDENGQEWQWNARFSNWVQLIDEALREQFLSAYKTPGVDDDEPAFDPTKKRKAAALENENAKKQKQKQPKERVNTAVYVSSLPNKVDEDELYMAFRKCGLIAESIDDNKPRIKLYRDGVGELTGDALIVFHRPESVELAIELLDMTELIPGMPGKNGPMRVVAADQNYKAQNDQPTQPEEVKKKGTASKRDRQKAIAKAEEMSRRLADWDEDDISATLSAPTSSAPISSRIRWDTVVIFKHMFSLEDFAGEDAGIVSSDMVADLREMCTKYGKVENVDIFTGEPEGIMTVRFAYTAAAKVCIAKNNGRMLDGRPISATMADGSERFEKHS